MAWCACNCSFGVMSLLTWGVHTFLWTVVRGDLLLPNIHQITELQAGSVLLLHCSEKTNRYHSLMLKKKKKNTHHYCHRYGDISMVIPLTIPGLQGFGGTVRAAAALWRHRVSLAELTLSGRKKTNENHHTVNHCWLTSSEAGNPHHMTTRWETWSWAW